MLFLADEDGKVTDCNLAALHSMKEGSNDHKMLSLSNLGLKNLNPNILKRQNGMLTTL